MHDFGSDPDDTPSVDSGFESSATSMFSGLPQERHGSQRTSSDQPEPRIPAAPEEQNSPGQQPFSKVSRLTSSDTRDTRGYVDAASAQEEEPPSYEATKIFDQASYASKSAQQDSRRNTRESRAQTEDSSTSFFPPNASGMFAGDSSNRKSLSSSSRRASSSPLVTASHEEAAFEGPRRAAAKSRTPPSIRFFDKIQRYLPALLILNALLLITLILLLTLRGIPG
jgi:hypothetical protein